MKALMPITASGPMLILSSLARLDDDVLISELRNKGIEKFMAYEVPSAEVERIILEAVVGRPPRCVPWDVRQGTRRRNSRAIATRCNTAGRGAGGASGVVAPLTQPVNRSRAEIRADFSGLSRW
ncbi:hypothetical protein Thimo_2632 [Thioflavicoccus mobilis 8321]|uniref:Uncharacterized protein n=1 Tax=Thioflavicoccus mobilis 8321 TaxID=765912 RepID=L0GZV8_9GAMM|nr:hypothetical protein Thimo_2632 [Thioflavicoccus mobilis 8321]